MLWSVASERVSNSDECSLSRRWRIHPLVARDLGLLDRWAADVFSAEGLRWPGVFIISGYRSPSFQARLNPAVPQSLHTRCPALAVDLRLGDLPASTTTIDLWRFLGTRWKALGGRWGGDFSPIDPNHFDLRFLDVPN